MGEQSLTASPLETDALADLVRARHACLTRLRDLGSEQIGLIEGGNITALLDVLSAKQRPLSDLRRIERALDPFRGQDPESRRWSAPGKRAVCARLAAQCDALLGEIVRQERQCEAAMIRRRDETADRLQQFRQAGQACGAYAAASRVKINQLDLSSET